MRGKTINVLPTAPRACTQLFLQLEPPQIHRLTSYLKKSFQSLLVCLKFYDFMSNRFVSPLRSSAGKSGGERHTPVELTSRQDPTEEGIPVHSSLPSVSHLDHQLKRQQEPLEGLWKAWSGTLEAWERHRGRGERRIREAAKLDLLSSRERQVLDWMESGKSLDETATILSISPRSVEKHRQNLRAKLRPVKDPPVTPRWKERPATPSPNAWARSATSSAWKPPGSFARCSARPSQHPTPLRKPPRIRDSWGGRTRGLILSVNIRGQQDAPSHLRPNSPQSIPRS